MKPSPLKIRALSSSVVFVAIFFLGSCKKSGETNGEVKPAESRGASPAPGSIEARPFLDRVARTEGEPLFDALGAEKTGIDFGPYWEDPASVLKEFIFLNPSGGICTGDCDGDGLVDLYITSPSGGNRLYRNLGEFRFEDVTERSGVADPDFWGTGASFVDIDNDGNLEPVLQKSDNKIAHPKLEQ